MFSNFTCDATAEGALRKARSLLAIIAQEFEGAGLELNIGPGKTEAILSLRGPT